MKIIHTNKAVANGQPPLEQVVANAPSLSEGEAAITNYINSDVVQKELTDLQDKSDYAPEKAVVVGRKQGLSNDNSPDFPSKCRNAYREIMQHARIVLTGIVKREKNVISNTIKASMPDMKRLLAQKLNHNEVEKLTATAEKRRKAEQKVDKFLMDRGLDLDSPEAREGDGYDSWKFYVPLIVMLIVEVAANSFLLHTAAPMGQLQAAGMAVSGILILGFFVNYFLKVKSGIYLSDHRRPLKKSGCYIGIASCFTVFAGLLGWLVLYRSAGIANIDPASIYLVLINIAFFIFAITVTFRNATCRIYGYDKLAKERGKRIREYKQIRGHLHNQAQAVFDETNANIAGRENKSNKIEMNWQMIKDTCEQIPTLEADAIKIIDQQYTATIEKYREGFEKGYFPDIEIQENVRGKIPAIVRIGTPIILLVQDTKSMQKLPAFGELSSMNFEEEIKQFAESVVQWKQKNSDFEELNEFGRSLISKHRERILQEMQDDGIAVDDNKQSEVGDG